MSKNNPNLEPLNQEKVKPVQKTHSEASGDTSHKKKILKNEKRLLKKSRKMKKENKNMKNEK